MSSLVRAAALSAVVVAALAGGAAHAGTAILDLKRASLTNVTDAAGLYQQEGGDVVKSGVTVGSYVITRRVTTGGTTTLNTAATSVTLFFPVRAGAPNNITLAGAHDFNSGDFQGSVSGASTKYSWLREADASYVPNGGYEQVTLSWTGASQLYLP